MVGTGISVNSISSISGVCRRRGPNSSRMCSDVEVGISRERDGTPLVEANGWSDTVGFNADTEVRVAGILSSSEIIGRKDKPMIVGRKDKPTRMIVGRKDKPTRMIVQADTGVVLAVVVVGREDKPRELYRDRKGKSSSNGPC